jgi:hypothetical protein
MNENEKQEIQKKENQERMSNCATELLAVLHKYDCLLSINSQVDANGNINSGIGIIPIQRQVNQVVEPEELKEPEEEKQEEEKQEEEDVS